MPYKQAKAFNQSSAGKVAGYCLQNVRKGYGIPARYPNAISAWKNTEQHKDRNIPNGVDAPLFYAYKTEGHINVRLADGHLWNDGRVYTNLAEYERNHGAVKYLGWGESLNSVRVLAHYTPPAPNDQNNKEEDMPVTERQVRLFLFSFLGLDGRGIGNGKRMNALLDAPEVNKVVRSYVDKKVTLPQLLEEFWESGQAKAYRDKEIPQVYDMAERFKAVKDITKPILGA